MQRDAAIATPCQCRAVDGNQQLAHEIKTQIKLVEVLDLTFAWRAHGDWGANVKSAPLGRGAEQAKIVGAQNWYFGQQRVDRVEPRSEPSGQRWQHCERLQVQSEGWK